MIHHTGWLEPLLDRIARDPTTAVCPVIDVINDDNFQIRPSRAKDVQVGGFNWGLIVRNSPDNNNNNYKYTYNYHNNYFIFLIFSFFCKF